MNYPNILIVIDMFSVLKLLFGSSNYKFKINNEFILFGSMTIFNELYCNFVDYFN